jgi:hypothetical protein
MYKIIGADQREYGPCSVEDLRQWHREGRLNAQTQVQAAGSAEWKPLAAYPELAAILSGAPPTIQPFMPPGSAPSTPIPAEELLRKDYELDVLSCLSRAWNLTQKNFLPVVGISFLVFVASGIVNNVIGLISRPAMTDMMQGQFSPGGVFLVLLSSLLGGPVEAVFFGGLYRYYLKLIRGQEAELGDAFSGFSLALGPLVLLGLVQALLVWLGICLCVLPGIYLGIAWAFAVPIVIDRRLDFWSAMELSRKVVSRHWFTILALVVLSAVVAMAGLLACCVGIFVTTPVAAISLMYAYEDIFSRRAVG